MQIGTRRLRKRREKGGGVGQVRDRLNLDRKRRKGQREKGGGSLYASGHGEKEGEGEEGKDGLQNFGT